MFVAQRKRFFPLPDYIRSTDQQVVLEVYGHAIDLNYTRLLLQRQDLDLGTVVLLDRVQKKYPIPDETAAGLRRVGLVQGRKPNWFVSAAVAAATGRRADYTRNKGLAKDKLKAFVLQHLREFGPTPRIHLDELLFSALPQGLTDEQKKHKVKNLLTEMRAKDGSIRTNFQGKASVWAMAGAESFNEREH